VDGQIVESSLIIFNISERAKVSESKKTIKEASPKKAIQNHRSVFFKTSNRAFLLKESWIR